MKPIIKVLLFMLPVVLLSQCEEEIEFPSVNTKAITNITSISAVLGGVVASDGGGTINGYGIVWVASNNPASGDYIILNSVNGSFSTTIYKFLPNTTYIVKAYAYNKEGVTYGEEEVFTTLNPLRGTFTDSRDSNAYKWIEIGKQIWMAENMNYHADSGCSIYDNISSNAEIYGRLYNWETACDICPEGWHLPSDDEWKELEVYLGISNHEVESQTLFEIGRYLKEANTLHWPPPNTAINNTGFTALPSGYYSVCTESFINLGFETAFWSSTEYNSINAWSRDFLFSHENGYRGHYDKSYRFSVRCVKDE